MSYAREAVWRATAQASGTRQAYDRQYFGVFCYLAADVEPVGYERPGRQGAFRRTFS